MKVTLCVPGHFYHTFLCLLKRDKESMGDTTQVQTFMNMEHGDHGAVRQTLDHGA